MEQDKQLVLLLDSGNTRLKCRCIDAHNGVLYQQFSLSNTQVESVLPVLAQSMGLGGLAHSERDVVQTIQALAGKVVAMHAVAVTSPALKQAIQQLFQATLGSDCPTIEWHHSAQDTRILRNLYEPIHHLGNDRWFGMIGVLSHAQAKQEGDASKQAQNTVSSKTKPAPGVISQTKLNADINQARNTISKAKPSERAIMYISFGTATTVDTIYEQDFLGGMILPGVDLMQNSLKQGTAQLPLVTINAETRVDTFPRGTQAAITAGIVAAQAGAIVRQCLLVYEQFGSYPDIYVAGGARFGVLAELKRILSSLGQALNQSVSAEIEIYELEAPVLDGLHYHYVKESLGK
ncbi:MAG: type III pantothenate kinase [Pelistega sp.]|nr:type III pantothenate kinase [Pelistega sp.]